MSLDCTTLKILLVGDMGVGKTFMLHQFLLETLAAGEGTAVSGGGGSGWGRGPASSAAAALSPPPLPLQTVLHETVLHETIVPTQGVGFETCTLYEPEWDLKGHPMVKLHIWDASGRDAFRGITECYLKGVHGALCVFDLSSRHSFSGVGAWLGRLKQHAPDACIILVGRRVKSRERAIPPEEGVACAINFNVRYAEDEGARAVFNLLIKGCLANKEDAAALNPGGVESGLYTQLIPDSHTPQRVQCQSECSEPSASPVEQQPECCCGGCTVS
jgi:GTPase SAR1 family protein